MLSRIVSTVRPAAIARSTEPGVSRQTPVTLGRAAIGTIGSLTQGAGAESTTSAGNGRDRKNGIDSVLPYAPASRTASN